MIRNKKIVLALVAIVVLVGGTAFTVQPMNAYGCAYYHTVRHGQSLSWIGRSYGVNWVYLAQVNRIPPPRYTIYPGQVLCIPSGRYYPSYNPPYYPPNYNPPNYPYNPPVYYPPNYSYTAERTWSFSILNVAQDTSVTVQTQNIPDYVKFNVSIGRNMNGRYDWISLTEMDTGTGGAFQVTFPIPAEYAGSAQLILRMVQNKQNGKSFSQDQWFNNVTGDKGIVSYNNTPVYYNNYYNPGYRPNYYPPSGPWRHP
jgi:LysM repeat protein